VSELYEQYRARWIASEKERILKLLQERELLGERIDPEDTDAVIVAAFHAGRMKVYETGDLRLMWV